MNYQSVVDMALSAYTLNECRAAEQAITHWLAAHPEDLGLHEIAGSLGIVKEAALEREAAERVLTAASPPLTTAAR